MDPSNSQTINTDSSKRTASDEEDDDDKCLKSKRAELEIEDSDFDIKLAEKLDKCLSLGGGIKPRFFMNKAKESTSSDIQKVNSIGNEPPKLKPRNLSKDELRERIIKKYDTLVPELDPERHKVKLVKVLSANESIELGKLQARKQLERQLELNSVAGNRAAVKNGINSFRFNDGYEIPSNDEEH